MCPPHSLSVHGIKYSRVCGKIIGYQYYTVDAFGPYYHNQHYTIDNQYVDGYGYYVSLTTSFYGVVPPFIGQDYFCDVVQAQFYHADLLWDGSGCGSTSSCCGFNNPPWFCKQLPQPTTDDIEMRVCVNEDINNEDIALESVEIYVQ